MNFCCKIFYLNNILAILLINSLYILKGTPNKGHLCNEGNVCSSIHIDHAAVYKSASELGTPLYRTASWLPMVFHCIIAALPL